MRVIARGGVHLSLVTFALLAVVGLLDGCSLFKPSHAPELKLFTLDDDISPPGTSDGTLTVIVKPLRSAAGFASPRIAYVRSEHQLAYYTQSAWVESPADMLAPLLVRAIARTGAFHASLPPGSTARSDLQLEAEVLRLQQEFATLPSRVRLTLRVSLVASASRRVLATRLFESVADAQSEDASGGVAAANLATRKVLTAVADWSATVAQAEHATLHPSGSRR